MISQIKRPSVIQISRLLKSLRRLEACPFFSCVSECASACCHSAIAQSQVEGIYLLKEQSGHDISASGLKKAGNLLNADVKVTWWGKNRVIERYVTPLKGWMCKTRANQPESKAMSQWKTHVNVPIYMSQILQTHKCKTMRQHKVNCVSLFMCWAINRPTLIIFLYIVRGKETPVSCFTSAIWENSGFTTSLL